jgi:hypothetical protein
MLRCHRVQFRKTSVVVEQAREGKILGCTENWRLAGSSRCMILFAVVSKVQRRPPTPTAQGLHENGGFFVQVVNLANRRISNLQIPLTCAVNNSVPGHHIFNDLARSSRPVWLQLAPKSF